MLLVTLQKQFSLPFHRLVKILTGEFVNENLYNIKYIEKRSSRRLYL